MYGILSLRLTGVKKVNGVHRIMLKSKEVRYSQKWILRLGETANSEYPLTAVVNKPQLSDAFRLGYNFRHFGSGMSTALAFVVTAIRRFLA